ncbi:hypothetical protein [Sneathiella sp.]|uniref:hypothetical protein n=1 Tax=Sneathiella sp. TaxID=1964365 RepID=UPI0025D6C7C0|nr:hypothetical protein [Sneathiella sp.]
MMDLGVDLWAAVFQAATFLCLMAVPWTDGKLRLLVGSIAGAGLLLILAFQFYIGVKKQDYGLGADLMIVTLANAALYLAISWGVERVFRLFLLKRKKDGPPSSS